MAPIVNKPIKALQNTESKSKDPIATEEKHRSYQQYTNLTIVSTVKICPS